MDIIILLVLFVGIPLAFMAAGVELDQNTPIALESTQG